MKKKKKNKLIFGAGLHAGGGLFILNYLRSKITSKGDIFFLDQRIILDKFYNNFEIYLVKNNLISKFYSELKIKIFFDNPNSEIIFLNGLPPFFKFKAKVTAYFQNANILKKNNFLLKNIFSLDFLRNLKFIFFYKNVDKWIVFSKFSKTILSRYIEKNKIFENKVSIDSQIIHKKKIYDFIYPASGEPHKNHENLIKALIILSNKKIFPKILLTLSESELSKLKIKYYKNKFNLKIFNKKIKDRKIFLKNYNYSKALIFPSYTETLGLPLLEAKSYHLDILASNYDFARDYTIKNRLFDPSRPEDIARKILNYVKNKK